MNRCGTLATGRSEAPWSLTGEVRLEYHNHDRTRKGVDREL